MLPALAVASLSCTKTEEIVFDHELQAFESREGKILIEAIMPQASTADEEIYIVGAFNGYVAPEEGEEAPEYKNPEFLMERSAVIPQKWGIYLDPSSFVGGKTLADGFTFISVKQGEERGPKGDRVSHTLAIGPGEWANVYVDKWAKYFEKDPGPQPLPTHDGVRIYIVDQTGWDAIALYQWGDENNLGGGWPGAQVSGELDYQGTHYKYFDYEDSIIGKTQNLIFNNNGGGTQLSDYAITFEDGVKDYFLVVTADGVSSLDAPVVEESIPEHEGEVWVSIIDQTGWDAIALYQWGTENNLGGDWPGAQVSGTFDYKGQTWKYFAYGVDEVVGKGQNLIFNNNGGGTQLGDYALTFEEGVSDYLLVVTADGVAAYEEGGSSEPDQPDQPVDPKKASVTIYVDNQAGYESLAMYMYGDKELCGGWPGLTPSGTEEIAGTTYHVFVVEDAMDRAENIILNNNGGGSQLADFAVTFAKETYYFIATEEGLAEIEDPHPAGTASTIYVADNSGWDGLALYAWSDAEAFGGWPGATPSGSVSLSGVKYKTFAVSAELSGKNENLIFNNAGAGSQFDGPNVTLGNNLFYSITASACKVVENPSIRIYVINETGWDELHLYSWGGGEYFGSWPGAVPAGKQTIDEVEYDYFDVPAEAFAAAGDCNFIFNNNAGTQYENDPGLKGNKATHDYFFKLTSAGASVIE